MRTVLFAFFSFIACVSFFGITPDAQAQGSSPVNCHQITIPSQVDSLVPALFGSPFDFTLLSQPLFIKVQCSSLTSATLTAGSGATTQYIYEHGHYWNGSAWQEFSLTGTQKTGEWLVGTGNSTITPASSLQNEPNYIVSYICSWSGSQWKCGCRNSICGTAFWQLQTFVPSMASTGSSSGGSTSSGSTSSGSTSSGSTSSGGGSSSGSTSEFPDRILMVGNSHTMGVHPVFKNLLATTEFKNTVVDIDAVGDSYMKDHYNRQSVTNKINSGNYDVVVIQGHSVDATKSTADFREYGKRMIDRIRAAGAEPVLYMTWQYKNNTLDFNKNKNEYITLGAANNVKVVPTGIVIDGVRSRNGGLELYLDNNHLNPTGNYAIASTFYAFFSGKSPVGLTFTNGLPSNTVTFLRQTVQEEVTEFGQYY